MSVISAFNFVFSADTSGIDDGMKKGDKAAADMTKSLNTADVAAGKLTASFGDMLKGALAAGAALMTWGAVKSIALASAEHTNALAENARALRMDVDELATWTGVIEKAGGSASEFHGTLKNLMQRTRDPLDALTRVADRFKGLSDLQADKLGERLGLDKGTIEAMRNGSEGLRKLIADQQRLGMVTAEQVETARKFKMQLQDTNTVMDDIRRRIATMILPVLTRWLEVLQDLFIWMRDKKEFVIGFFAAAATIITVALLPALMRATAATWAFAAPWLPLIALFVGVAAAIALVVDDVHAFRNGANSMIGEISKNWPIVGVVVNEICDALEMLMDIAGAAFQFLVDGLLRPSKAFENFGKAVDSVLARMAEKFPYLYAAFEGLGRMGSAAMQTISTAFELGWAIIRPIIEAMQAAFKAAASVASGVVGLFTGDKPKPLTTQSTDARGAGAVPQVASNSVMKIPTAAPAAPQKKDTQTSAVSQIPTAAPAAPQKAEKESVLQIPKTGPAPAKEKVATDKAPTAAPMASAPAAARAVEGARPVAAAAASHPMSSSTSNSISNTKNASKTTSVQIGTIEVKTQATDAKGVSESIGKSLQEQLQSANDEFDDGIVS